MNTASNWIRAAILAALLASCPAPTASAKSHATAHAHAAVHSHNAAKQATSAWQHQEQAMMHQQQAMMKQSNGHHQTSTHRYPSRHSSGNRRYSHYNNNTHRPTNAQILSGLHSVMSELNRADHDYQGHRAQAIQHLNTAVRSLQPQGSNANLGMNANLNANRVTLTSATGNRNGVAGAPGAAAHRMPQAQSDAHLKQGRQRLLTFQNQMANTNSNQHHKVVYTHAQKAMQELNLALNIR